MTADAGRSRSVTIVVTTDRRRGAEVRAERIGAGLRDRGWRVELLALTTDPSRRGIDAEAVTDTHPDALGRFTPGVFTGLWRRLRRRPAGLVVANGSATLRYAVAARQRRIPLVYVSIGEPAYWIRTPRQRALNRLLMRRVDLVLAVSAETGRQTTELLGVPPSRVEVARGGVPADLLEVAHGDHDGPCRVLFLGSLSKEKDPLAAIEAATRAGAPIQLRFVGAGPLGVAIDRAAGEAPGHLTIERVGSADDVRPHLAWSDVLVLPSRTEGLPGAVLEAAAAGVPVVAYDAGGTAEVVRDGETGRVVSRGDVASLAAALGELAMDRATVRRMGAAAREMVRDEFLIDHAVDRYDEVFSSFFGS